jgi:hypothetical protein
LALLRYLCLVLLLMMLMLMLMLMLLLLPMLLPACPPLACLQLVVSFPVRRDVLDDMDDEGQRELSQLMQLLHQVRCVLWDRSMGLPQAAR